MADHIEEIEYKGHLIRIYRDDDPQNPRKDCDNLGTMVCLHRRYDLGDEHEFDKNSPREFEEYREKNADKIVTFDLYLYDHSGITISVNPFSCPWDSGQIGGIYVTHAKLRKEFGRKFTKERLIEKGKEILLQEVKIYDQYLQGEVYGYRIFEKGAEEQEEDIDACWGYYGCDKEYMITEAKEIIDHRLKKAA